MPAQTAGVTHLFALTPGDGHLYRILFGRLPAHAPSAPAFVLFGFAQGTHALHTIVAQTDDLSPDSFATLWRDTHDPHVTPAADHLESMAYSVFAALVGIPHLVLPYGWDADWRDDLPIAVRG